jgi:hypothetical protein
MCPQYYLENSVAGHRDNDKAQKQTDALEHEILIESCPADNIEEIDRT